MNDDRDEDAGAKHVDETVAVPEKTRPWLFQKGNTAAVRHGARSKRIVLRRAREAYARLLDEHPALADYGDEAMAHCVSLATWSLFVEELDRCGVMVGDEPRASLSKEVRAWGGRCSEHRQRLGLSPTSQAKLLLDAATIAQGRQAMLDALPARLAALGYGQSSGQGDKGGSGT